MQVFAEIHGESLQNVDSKNLATEPGKDLAIDFYPH